MTCQHPLFESVEIQAPVSRENPEIWFQPIVDTFEHRILAHECLPRPSSMPVSNGGETVQAARARSLAIHSAAGQERRGLYFLNLVPSSIDDSGLDMSSTIDAVFDSGMQPGNLVFQMGESDLARDPAHSHHIREYLRTRGFGFALNGAGIGAGAFSFQAAADFEPDYINLDRRLIQNFDQPACAPAIGKLVQIAGKSNARVIAQGVDRVRMVENLWLLGVRFMQGHLFGDPSPYIA